MWNQHLKDSNNSYKMQIKRIQGFWRITPQQNCNLEFSEAHSNSRETDLPWRMTEVIISKPESTGMTSKEQMKNL